MIKTYDLLTAAMEPGGHWMVGLTSKEGQPELQSQDK
ncbi:hypothetical protein AN901_204747 [Pseudomonas syringae pv. theae]|nr:hypothetical protein AN901_204747 [Pseudomonas syringae pv. theae]